MMKFLADWFKMTRGAIRNYEIQRSSTTAVLLSSVTTFGDIKVHAFGDEPYRSQGVGLRDL